MKTKAASHFEKSVYLLLLIAAIGFLIRLFVIKVAWVDGDEGNYLYDAKLLLEGLVPYKDYLTRSPLYLVMLAIPIKVLGTTLIAGRIISTLSAAATTILLYFLGKELYNKRVGLLSSLVYALLPFAIFWSSVIKTEPNVAVFNVLALVLFLRALKSQRGIYFVLSGFVIGLAILIRESALVILFVEIIFMGGLFVMRSSSFPRKGAVDFLKNAFFIVSGTGFLYLLFLVPVVLFGFSPALGGFAGKFLGLFTDRLTHLPSLVRSGVVNMYTASLREGFLREGPGIAVAVALFVGLALKRAFPRASFFFKLIFCSGFILLALRLLVSGALNATPLYKLSLVLFLLLACIIVVRLDQQPGFIASNMLLVVWVGVLLLPYISHYDFHLMYFYEFLPAACVMIGAILGSLDDSAYKNALIGGFAILLIALSSFTANYYRESHGLFRSWSPSTVTKVSKYIGGKTRESEEIFTASTIFVFAADRKLVMNVSHPIIYSLDSMTPQALHSLGYPSAKEIIEHMKANKVRYVLNDNRTEYSFFFRHPELQRFVENSYALEKNIDDVEIRRLKR